jgi:hypothetical protein
MSVELALGPLTVSFLIVHLFFPHSNEFGLASRMAVTGLLRTR